MIQKEKIDYKQAGDSCRHKNENDMPSGNIKSARKRQNAVKFVGLLLSAAVILFNFSPRMRAVRALPNAVFVNSSTESNDERTNALPFDGSNLILSQMGAAAQSGGALRVAESGDETLSAKRISIRLFNLFELANVPVYGHERAMLHPGGRAVGISINLRGLLVVGRGTFKNKDGRDCCPAKRAGLRAGDIIKSINGTEISTSEEMQLALNASPERVQIVFERNDRQQTLTIKPETGIDGKVKIGAWVRDSTVGIGTLSFVTEKERASAALGHAVLDADTGSLLAVRKGEMVEADILGVTKGASGIPGELRGAFGEKSPRIGSIDINTELGIFGTADAADEILKKSAALPIAFPNEVHTGKACIITQTNGEEPQQYECRIIKTVQQSAPGQKGIVVEITDERLLSKTGGIVQGMSGSPIIQDGRVAAVVTHVFVNEPNRGYGVYAFWMYSTACGGN